MNELFSKVWERVKKTQQGTVKYPKINDSREQQEGEVMVTRYWREHLQERTALQELWASAEGQGKIKEEIP